MIENKNEIARTGENGFSGDRARSCCFTGHRKITNIDGLRIPTLLRKYVKGLYEKRGITRFYAGGALGFDTLAAEAVIALRDRGLPITLHLLIPCRDQDKYWCEEDVAYYREILSLADSVEYICESYTGFCMHQRNRALVDRSSVCVAYHVKDVGGTAYTVNYALSHGVEVFNIARGSGSSPRNI